MRTKILMIVALGLGLAACADPHPVDVEGEDIKITWEDTYPYGTAWSMLQPICNSEGIDDERCKCLLDMMVDEVGVDAAMYVAMQALEHDGPAAALKEDIGDLRTDRASYIYAYERDMTCAPQAVAPGGPNGAATSSAEDTAASNQPK